MKVANRANATLAFLTAALLMGGASAAGLTGNALLELCGAGLIGWSSLSIWRRDDKPYPRLFAITLCILIFVQFVPFPPGLWRHLSGREQIYNGFAVIGAAPPWLTLSLAPWDSLASLLWGLPALAIYVSFRAEGAPSSRSAILVVTVVAVLSTALEALQRGTGRGYIYAITNYGQGTGFFANSNHQGSFLLASLALFVTSVVARHRRNRHRLAWYRQASLLEWAVVVLLLAGVMISGSLACAGLLVLVVAALVVVGFPDVQPRPAVIAVMAIIVLTGLAGFIYFVPLANDLTGQGAVAGISRHEFLAKGLLILRDFKLVGSGLGTFVNIYPWYEQANQISSLFVNHAHDDLLELLIETGAFGLFAVVVFIAWYVRTSLPLWRAPRDRSIPLGAAVVIGVILLHSLVDYPLRTAAISSIFALACALLARRSDDGQVLAAEQHPQRRPDPSDRELIRI
jgi:putative inorganic carbon (hco3(-)) transporter